jgi:hypothetical protein
LRRQKPDQPPNWDKRAYRSAEKRAGKMDRGMLLEYADMAGTGMAMAFSDFRREPQDVSLLEAERGLIALWAVVQELRARVLPQSGNSG